ncbi:hypothetical protein BGX26_011868 [Mortierella sp. AD094]|nr:hypothetical protein BGX26_011868 [Mortierella sp. AD094]
MKHISSQSELSSQLTAAGTKLVVVDFFATWCGPCKTLAPVLEGLEKKHTSTIFAKVDVDGAQDCARKYEVTAMPTIVFFKSGSEKHEGGDAFIGTGQTLGGTSSLSGSSTVSSINAKTIEGPGGSCQIQVRLLDGAAIRGDFEPSHTLRHVHDFVKANLDARGAIVPSFSLMTNFPKVIYDDSALEQTLQDAKLTPRAQLIIKA